ncbi:hypothetical protein ABI59_17375 [Acidobacteria bacterium Mor1]|nr:hypothetical protein ABI59_17375 [Acidobacteria bacterium Mor1]
MNSRRSVAGKLAAIVLATLGWFALCTWAGLRLELPYGLAIGVSLLMTLPLSFWAVGWFLQPLTHTLASLSDGIRSFRDRDFSVRLATSDRDDELGELLASYNAVGEILQEERRQIRQRELLLQTALDQSPIAILLINPLQRILYSNTEARALFLGGEGKLEGLHFDELVAGCPEPMRAVLDSGGDGIFTVEEPDALPETYHLSRRAFFLNRRQHTLFLLRRMTIELARQEAEIWKKVIRVISHELNNSLAPISSLAHSGDLIADRPERAGQLRSIFESIRGRVDHLTDFLDGYARFAKLPAPRKEPVDWSEWLESLRQIYPFRLDGDPPAGTAHFDPSQLQQVVINLLKNAEEATEGEDPPLMRIRAIPDGRTRVEVLDRGRGMSEEVMQKALLPFYSTKKSGTGVGLPLCREIVEAHGGFLRIENRSGGGTTVSFWLP